MQEQQDQEGTESLKEFDEFEDLDDSSGNVWMTHTEYIATLPQENQDRIARNNRTMAEDPFWASLEATGPTRSLQDYLGEQEKVVKALLSDANTEEVRAAARKLELLNKHVEAWIMSDGDTIDELSRELFYARKELDKLEAA